MRQDVATIVNVMFKTIYTGYGLRILVGMEKLSVIAFVYDMNLLRRQVIELDDVLLSAL